MKIKTIWNENQLQFDNVVNSAMEEGYQLVRRDVLVDHDRLDDSVFYAELILPDPAPEAFHPLDLLHQVQTFCLSQAVEDCHANKCPLAAWCDQVREGGVDPSDWDLPEVLT